MNRNELDEKALFYLNKMLGINEKTRKEALIIREEIYTQLEVREIVKNYKHDTDLFKNDNNGLQIGNMNLICKEFCDINNNWIETVILYMISVPEIKEMRQKDMLTCFYIDMWQNAYISGAKALIREKAGNCFSFGPGYYGMEIKENEKLYCLLEGGKIGVKIKNNVMYPAKTCTGLLIKIKEEFRNKIKEKSPCKYCAGNRVSCDICQIGKERL